MDINIFNNNIYKISRKIEIINSQDDECPICLDNFYSADNLHNYKYLNCFDCLKCFNNNNNSVILNNCNHVFHEKCISKWKNIKKICPLCNKDFDFYITINIK
tara:strand:- start:4840 stop:5148 length:309 start_codon:yes stop_codon:yes gene_type:complete